MKQKAYIDDGRAFVACEHEVLSDGSIAWNLYLRGTADGHRDADVIHCVSEKRADEAFALIVTALRVATGINPLIL